MRIALAALLIGTLAGCAGVKQRPETASHDARAAATATQEGAIELSWQAPADRLNGAPLNPAEIAGYRIYVGEKPGRYSRTVEVNDPQQTNYLVRGLEPGKTYYVALTTVDRGGRESPKSTEIDLAAAPLTDYPDYQMAGADGQDDLPPRSRNN